MAATVTLDGTNITLADTITGWAQVRIRGTGGLPTISDSTDVFLQGGHAVTSRSTNSRLWLYFDNTTGLNFSTTHAGKHISIWANFLAAGLLQLSTYVSGSDRGGLCLCLGSTTANYSYWNMGGSDTYPGGWVRLTIDPSKTASGTAGTGLDLTSVRYFGVIFDTTTTAKFDNAIIDRIDYGYGLIAKGTSTSNNLFGDILAADEGDATNGKFGYVRSDQGIYYVQGRITLGDNVGTTASTLTDLDKVVVFESKKYMNSSSAWVDAVATGFHGLRRVGNNTNGTSLQFGTKVGTGDTASGRNGLTILSAGQNVTIDFDDGHTGTGRDLKLYGTTFRYIQTLIQVGNVGTFEFIGCTVDQCAKLEPQITIVRALVLSNTLSTTGALLWNESINIKYSNFIANTTGAAIDHPSAAGTPYSYTAMMFSGNTYDVRNSSGGAIVISCYTNSNPTTHTESAGGSTAFDNPKTLSITSLVSGTEIHVYKESDLTEYWGTESSGTEWSHGYNADDTPIFITLIKPGYKWVRYSGLTFGAAGISIIATQQADLGYNNPA